MGLLPLYVNGPTVLMMAMSFSTMYLVQSGWMMASVDTWICWVGSGSACLWAPAVTTKARASNTQWAAVRTTVEAASNGSVNLKKKKKRVSFGELLQMRLPPQKYSLSTSMPTMKGNSLGTASSPPMMRS